ncbi:hypothetical protein OL229_15995 [Neisseriaceae bacterium JH1-16]|nr:hypothetical protein [Neisseriaceae bacterium JH1-16]
MAAAGDSLLVLSYIPKENALAVLIDESSDRTALHDLLMKEAQRVADEHRAAVISKITPLPHTDRLPGCDAFLRLGEAERKALLARMTIRPEASSINTLPDDIANCLVNFPPTHRHVICTRLIEWWDLQIIFTLCGKRQRCISKLEVLEKISEIAGEIEREELSADFEMSVIPDGHKPD